MKSVLAVSKLPGVYCEETEIMNCYLYMIANYANVTYNHRYYVVNAWAIISGFWFPSAKLFPQIWVTDLDLGDELRFEWRTHIWVKPSGIPQIWVNPQIWAIIQNWGNLAQITQNWVLRLFLRVIIYLVECHYHFMIIKPDETPSMLRSHSNSIFGLWCLRSTLSGTTFRFLTIIFIIITYYCILRFVISYSCLFASIIYILPVVMATCLFVQPSTSCCFVDRAPNWLGNLRSFPFPDPICLC